MNQVARMVSHLDEVEPVEKTGLGVALNELAERMRRREIVMIFSDFFGDPDELESALHRMRYNKHEVVLFQIMHQLTKADSSSLVRSLIFFSSPLLYHSNFSSESLIFSII